MALIRVEKKSAASTIDLSNPVVLSSTGNSYTVANALQYKLIVATYVAGSADYITDGNINCDDSNHYTTSSINSGTSTGASCVCIPTQDNITFSGTPSGTVRTLKVVAFN